MAILLSNTCDSKYLPQTKLNLIKFFSLLQAVALLAIHAVGQVLTTV